MLRADPLYPHLRFLRISDARDKMRLLRILTDAYELRTLEELVPDPDRSRNTDDQMPARAVYDLALALGCKLAVIEADYVDRQSNITYVQLYARAFRDTPRRTVRIHFFREEVGYGLLLEEERLQAAYLGFSQLSPVRPRKIGRTVLPLPHGDGLWQFAPASIEVEVNLAGARLTAKGSPFIEQDQRVSACASAAAWMLTSVVGPSWGIPSLSMGEITQAATRHSLPDYGRGVSPGLNVGQILWGLNEMGYEPVSYAPRDVSDAREVIYQYVESGIPVILAVHLPERGGFHALTVVGHTYDPSRDVSKLLANQVHSTLAWVPHFLVHDDQQGLYLKMSLGDLSGGRISLHLHAPDARTRRVYSKLVNDWYKGATVHYIIAALPPRHTLRPEEAADVGQSMIIAAISLYRKGLKIKLPNPYIYRTYLTAANDFKRGFRVDSPTAVSGTLAALYRGSSLPKYVWVTELCTVAGRTSVPPEALTIVADVTIDPTSSADDLWEFVTLHIPGAFFRMGPTQSDYHEALESPVAYLEDDGPYPALIRLDCHGSP